MHFTYNFISEKEKFGEKVYNTLVENFPETFFVGGTVRDMLMHKNVMDIDIATAATPEKVIALLQSQRILCDDKHKRFGIIIAKQNKHMAEIATFRKDVYTNSRYPKVMFVRDIATDSQRRDFTANSLYFSTKTQQIIDLHQGIDDIEKRLIRFIGNAVQRIKEDPLRIMRAFRFQLELQFEFEIDTARALQNNLHLLNNISQNKLQSEIKKIASPQLQKRLLQVMHKSP